MIRKLEDKDIDKVMNIWLESTIKAHDFISKEYWESNYNRPVQPVRQRCPDRP